MMAGVDTGPAARVQPPVRRALGRALPVFALLLVGACVLAPLAGSTRISLRRAFDPALPFADNVDAQIFFIARLPRVLAAVLVGGSLAAAGVLFQALLRNPLATPYTLGVSAGAALGAMLAMTIGDAFSFGGASAVPAASLSGSLAAVAVVYALARARRRGFSTDVMLLAGVTMNAFFSAVILFVEYLADPGQTMRAVRWLMGDLDVPSYTPLLASLPLFSVTIPVFLVLPRALNLLSLGPEQAAARGVDPLRAQRLAFFSASLATGAAVSLGGPIGFIGIIVPHFIRLLVGADHRVVLPSALLAGGAFLVGCDVVARTALAPLELPVGIVTAVIGGPFFLWLLVSRTRGHP